MGEEAEIGQININEPPPPHSIRTLDSFHKLHQIGSGTFGQVYMAKEVVTGDIVALKKIRTDDEKEGFPITAIREIKILNKLRHQNIVKLKEVVISQEGPDSNHEQTANDNDHLVYNKYNGSVYLVLEYMDHDLTGLSDRPGLRFNVPQIKCYMKQLLTGLHFCHINDVIHRDIKGANLLLDNNGNLKLADFGLASPLSNRELTNRVITIPYRPPELLLGATNYGYAVDIWSAGCIFAELLHGKPIMSGRNEPEQLHKIFELCGSPDESNWPGVSRIRWYNTFKPAKHMRRRLREVFRHFDPDALDLLDGMLTLDPRKRITAKEALNAEYFWREPLPCDPKCLPKYESSHEFQTKKKRDQQRLNEETARRLRLRHPPPHARLPPLKHGGQVFQEYRPERNNPTNLLGQRPSSSSSYANSHADARLSNRYPPSGHFTGAYPQPYEAQTGGVSTGQYPPQGHVNPYAQSNMPNQPTNSHADTAGPPGFSQMAPNPNANSRNQQYGWQK